MEYVRNFRIFAIAVLTEAITWTGILVSGCRYNFSTHCSTLQHSTTLCNTLRHTATQCNTIQHNVKHCNTLQLDCDSMGWLRLVGSLKLQVSSAEYRLFYRALLQKRPIIIWSLLVVATPC